MNPQALSYSAKDLEAAYRRNTPRDNFAGRKAMVVDDINVVLVREVANLFPVTNRGHTGKGQRRAQCKAIFQAWREVIDAPRR